MFAMFIVASAAVCFWRETVCIYTEADSFQQDAAADQPQPDLQPDSNAAAYFAGGSGTRVGVAAVDCVADCGRADSRQVGAGGADGQAAAGAAADVSAVERPARGDCAGYSSQPDDGGSRRPGRQSSCAEPGSAAGRSGQGTEDHHQRD